ncbi:MAG: hypothetical protein PHI97_27435 [Desulfobulbus sp.]|nr:hypothetical protein [Desulfobulbus sp.]
MELIIEEKPLSPVEQSRLGELEATIRENLKAWYAVGLAMIEIRDSKLYRNDAGRTWEGYCREIFDMSHQHADRQISAAKVIENLTPIGVKADGTVDWELLPANEAQARELARLAPEEQVQVWGQLVDSKRLLGSANVQAKVTAKAVKNAVKALKGGSSSPGGDGIAAGLRKALNDRKKKDHHRKSDAFTAAWETLLEQVEEEQRSGWKETAREVVFDHLVELAQIVGDCGNQTMRDKKITANYRRQNLEKLIAAGWSVLRTGGELVIEQLREDGTWLVYGEYETQRERDAAFDDALLESNSIQA